jgi:hypothetical protein
MDQRRIGGGHTTKKSKKSKTRRFGVVPRILAKTGLNRTVKSRKEMKHDMWYILRDIHVDKLLEYITDNPNNMNENNTGYYAAKDALIDKANNAIENNSLSKMRSALKKMFALDAEYAGEANSNAEGEREYYEFIRQKLEDKLDEVTTVTGKTIKMNNILNSMMGMSIGGPTFVSPRAAIAVAPAPRATNLANSTINSLISGLDKLNIKTSR